jgi:S-methylmethionine-dependent homocysteine/selenocysteine methylase
MVEGTASGALRERLQKGPPLLLDGATGTELERRGLYTGLPLWSTHALLAAPDWLRRIHADHAQAGAEIVTAATFRTQRRTLLRASAADPGLAARDAELTQLAVRLAREGAAYAAHRVFVAGSAPPLEDCYRPDLVPAEEELAGEHARHAANLRMAGVDLILVETMNSLVEAVAAARAAQATALPFVVSFVCWEGAKLLSGEDLAEALDRITASGPLGVAVNCLPPASVPACLSVLQSCGMPFGIYANLGELGDDSGFAPGGDCTPDEFARHGSSWIRAGARLVGGCCGATPDHTRAMARALAQA